MASTDKENKSDQIEPGELEVELNRSCFECNLSLSKSRHLINIEDFDSVGDSPGSECKPSTRSQEADCGREGEGAEKKMINLKRKRCKIWHSECFKCNICKQSLEREQSCYIYKDKIVCRDDYAILKQTNLNTCERCRFPLTPSDWVRKIGPSFAYHLTCFTCDICSRELKTGEKFIFERRATRKRSPVSGDFSELNESASNQQQSSSSTSKIEGKHSLLMCELHFGQDLNYATNSSCNPTYSFAKRDEGDDNQSLPSKNIIHKIPNNHKSNPNQISDSNNESELEINQSAMYSRLQIIDCADSNNSLITPTSSSIQASFVMQHHLTTSSSSPNHDAGLLNIRQSDHSSGFHHLHQMKPTLNNEAQPGDQLQQHECLQSADNQLDSVASTLSSQCSSSQPKTNNLQQLTMNQHQLQHHLSTSSGAPSSSSSSSKSKRVRTTFTEEQLAILQTQFQSDSNPDGQDLERIATITGLSKRVTQVWFQNSRARQKKYMIKRKSGVPIEAINSVVLGLDPNNLGELDDGRDDEDDDHDQDDDDDDQGGADDDSEGDGHVIYAGLDRSSALGPPSEAANQHLMGLQQFNIKPQYINQFQGARHHLGNHEQSVSIRQVGCSRQLQSAANLMNETDSKWSTNSMSPSSSSSEENDPDQPSKIGKQLSSGEDVRG